MRNDLWRGFSTYIMSFWSSATDPNRDSWSRCQDTSSTTAVCPVKMVLASTTLPSLGTALISHKQMVFKTPKKVKNYIFRLSFPPPAPNQDVFCPSQGTARAGLAQLCSKHSHDHQKHSANAHWGLGSRTAHTPPSGAHGDAGQGCTLQKDLEQGRVRIPGAGIIPSTFWNSWH